MRRFLPALRGVEGKALDVPLPADLGPVAPDAIIQGREFKSVYVSGGYQSVTYQGSPGYGTEDRAASWDMATVIVNGYERVVWVFKSVEFYAGHQSRLPFRIGRNLGSDDEEVLEDHPLYRVLNKQANPMETGRQFRKRLSAQVLLSKRGAFVEVTRSRLGTITRLDLLPPDRVRPIPDPRGDYLSHYEFITRYGEMREIAPERVRWIREPHPTDPFSGVTPLEAAGISVELDHLSRLYNVSFIKNDGRPGGVLGVDTDGVDEQELDRIEQKFAPGVQRAGQIIAIGTGQGGIKYVDTTTKPRDMAYSEASQNAKTEILSAFGLDESVFGTVAGRTFDNAEQALYNAYTQSLIPHFDLVATAFGGDIDDEWDPFIDTATVEVLELPRRQKRDEARKEVEQGTRSVDEYRPLAGLKPLDTPFSRAVWISPQKAPIPGRPEDAAALGVGQGGGSAQPGPAGGAPAGPDGQPVPPAPGGVDATQQPDAASAPPPPDPNATPAPATPATPAPAPTGPAAQALADALAAGQTSTPAGAAAAVDDAATLEAGNGPGAAAAAVTDAKRKLERKSIDTTTDYDGSGYSGTDTPAGPSTLDTVSYEPDENEITGAEMAISAALDSLLARQQSVIVARLDSPKTRKGTRYWTADGPDDTRASDNPVDAEKVLDPERWATETSDTLTPIVSAHAQEAAALLIASFAAGGVIAGINAATPDDPTIKAAAAMVTARAVYSVITSAAEAMRAWLADVATRLNTAQHDATDISVVADAIRSMYADQSHTFAKSLGLNLASATVNSACDAAANDMTVLPTVGPNGGQPSLANNLGITRQWTTMHDEKVRPTHAAVDGETTELGDPFHVGASILRYPGDPLGPASETRNCRCRLRYSTSRGARFVLSPVTAAA